MSPTVFHRRGYRLYFFAMKSLRRGKRTLPVEVRDVSPRGFSLALGERVLHVSFGDFPWFRAFTIDELVEAERP